MNARLRRRLARLQPAKPALMPPPMWMIELPETGYDDENGIVRAMAELGLEAPPGVPPLVISMTNPALSAPRLWDGDPLELLAMCDEDEPAPPDSAEA